MDQLVFIPQQFYEQKIQISPKRYHRNDGKQESVPKILENVYNKVKAKTEFSGSNESLLNETLTSTRIKLSLIDSICFRRKRLRRCICRFCPIFITQFLTQLA